MNSNLFKSAEFYRRRYYNFATFLIIPLFSLVIFILLFSLIAEKEISVTSQGEITPTKIVASIQSTSNNTIVKNYLLSNKLVNKNDLIIQYAETLESSQKQSLETQLIQLEKQKNGIVMLKDSLSQGTNLFTNNDEFGYINTYNNFVQQSEDIALGISKANTEVDNQANLANNTVTAIDNQINNLNQQIDEYKELSQAISNNQLSLSADNPHKATLDNYLAQSQQQSKNSLKEQYLSQINQSISSIESSIATLNIQRASTGSTSTYDNSLSTKIEALRSQFLQNASQQLTTIENQITETRAQLNQANIHLDNNTIKAPDTGILHLNNEYEGKNIIPIGSEIAQLYPDISNTKEVLITYYVSSNYVSLLKINQKVRFSLDKIGNEKITVLGRINSVDRTATKTEQGNLFKITAYAKLNDKESNIIQYGLQGRVTSIISKKTYFNYYKDKILTNYY